MPLHLTKVAVGCSSVEVLGERLLARSVDGAAPVWTRYRPTRHEDVVGGSLFWIIKNRLVARQPILGFVEDEEARRWIIRVGVPLVAVRPIHRRAHQGWRYLAADDAPPDIVDGEDDGETLPPRLAADLAALLLI